MNNGKYNTISTPHYLFTVLFGITIVFRCMVRCIPLLNIDQINSRSESYYVIKTFQQCRITVTGNIQLLFINLYIHYNRITVCAIASFSARMLTINQHSSSPSFLTRFSTLPPTLFFSLRSPRSFARVSRQTKKQTNKQQQQTLSIHTHDPPAPKPNKG